MKTKIPNDIFLPSEKATLHDGGRFGDYWLCFDCKDIKTELLPFDIRKIDKELLKIFNDLGNSSPIVVIIMPDGKYQYKMRGGWTLKMGDGTELIPGETLLI